MTNRKSLSDRPRRIELPNDVLVIDEDFHREVLAGASRRTGKRLESEGLPFVMVTGIKYRPLNAGRAWLADRITRKNQTQKRRRA
jgi:hypothetical protein